LAALAGAVGAEKLPGHAGEFGLCIALGDLVEEFPRNHERDAALARIGTWYFGRTSRFGDMHAMKGRQS
jgi:hypothetical protein